MEAPVREMPRYKSHKTVWALKIAQVVPKENPDPTGQSAAASYGARIVPADVGYAPFDVPAEYVTKHNPQPGGYYVVYADGYKSFSPAKAFEEGNTLIPESHLDRVREEKRELDERIARLSAFLVTEMFNGLGFVEQANLQAQRTAMTAYSSILGKRLAGTTGDSAVPSVDTAAGAPAGTVSVLNDGCSVITVDDGCYVLKNLIQGEWKTATHIFPEALEAMQKLGNPRALQQSFIGN